MRIVKFYKDKNDTATPDDSYQFNHDGDSGWGWCIHNWLTMYPNGKVEFVEEN